MQVNGQYGETKTDSICQNLISKPLAIRLLLAFPTLINTSLNSGAENKKLIRYPEILSIIKPRKAAHSPKDQVSKTDDVFPNGWVRPVSVVQESPCNEGSTTKYKPILNQSQF